MEENKEITVEVQTSIQRQAIKPFRELNLSDDFMFNVAADNLECCKIICAFDLFGLGKYRYTFTNRCEEVPDLEFGDESTKIILNTKGRNESEVEQSLVDFLHYVESSKAEDMPENCDERLMRLHEVIESIKANSEMEAVYVKAETREREIIADAKQEESLLIY